MRPRSNFTLWFYPEHSWKILNPSSLMKLSNVDISRSLLPTPTFSVRPSCSLTRWHCRILFSVLHQAFSSCLPRTIYCCIYMWISRTRLYQPEVAQHDDRNVVTLPTGHWAYAHLTFPPATFPSIFLSFCLTLSLHNLS